MARLEREHPSPIGESIEIFGVPREIVGVVGEVRHRGLEAEVQPTMHVPLHQNPMSALSLVVRADGDPAALLPEVRWAVAAIDPDLPVFGAALLEEAIYGTVALGVAERRHEIGVRLALGGDRGDVLRLVLAEGMGLALAGVALGVAGALTARGMIAALVFDVGTADPATYAAVAAAPAAVALAASWIPARRATAVDPAVMLQHE
jgi:putative ABC transport system permease protein